MLTDFTFFGQIFPLISLLATLADRRPHYQVLTVTCTLAQSPQSPQCSHLQCRCHSLHFCITANLDILYSGVCPIFVCQHCTVLHMLSHTNACSPVLLDIGHCCKHCKTSQNIALQYCTWLVYRLLRQ